MSLFSRRNFLIVFASVSVLGGCGFTPIYSDGSAASGLSGTIEIIAGKGRENFEMRERLVERFGFANDPRYRLTYTYVVDLEGLAVSQTAEITRYNLYGVSDFKVINSASGAVLFSGKVKSTTAYSATSETYPTRVAEQDARSRLALALADQIVTQVSATANQWVK
ncbi:MAG: LPS assembly lipoprotein LptE [Amylibacter sp.]